MIANNGMYLHKKAMKILFNINGNTVADIVTKSGATLVWTIEGVSYTQNNVPAHTYLNQGGFGKVESSDGFLGVTGFRMENSHLIGALDFSVLSNLTGQLLLGGNQFSSIILPTLASQLSTFRLSGNTSIISIDMRSFSHMPRSCQFDGCSYLTSVLFNIGNASITLLPVFTGCSSLVMAFDFSGFTSVTTPSIAIGSSGITSFKAPTSNNLGTLTADSCPNLLTLDLSGANGLNGVARAEGCALMSNIIWPTSHVGSISNFLFNNNPFMLQYNLSGLTFDDTGTFRLANNIRCTSLIMPISSTFKRSIDASGCDLGYVNFTNNTSLLSANSISILLNNNNMLASEVNHVLFDLANLVSAEPSGGSYTGRVINIGGTNEAPDSTSGGYDGVTARSLLQSKGIIVTI